MKNIPANRALLFLMLIPIAVSAQVRSDTLFFNFSPREEAGLVTSLDKQLNTYNLNSTINFNQYMGPFGTQMSASFLSTVINSTPQNIKDEQYLQFTSAYKLSNQVFPGIWVQSNVFSDNRRTGLNEASNTSAAIFIKIFPYKGTYIAPFGGFLNSKLIGENDKGYIWGTEGNLENFEIEGFNLNSSLKIVQEDISPRKNFTRHIRILSTNNIDASSKNTLQGYYSKQSKDLYFEADSLAIASFSIANNIQSRIETNYSLQDQLVFQLNNLLFDFSARSIWRTIERNTRYRMFLFDVSPVFNTKTDEFRLEFESVSHYTTEIFNGMIRYLYSERNETNMPIRIDISDVFLNEKYSRLFEEREKSERQKNNRNVRMAVAIAGNLFLTKKDQVSFSAMHSKLKYDTPSEENYDDRDELLTTFRITYLKNMNSVFDLHMGIEGSLNHTVYILSQRSSNNNYSRIIKFSTGGDYKGLIISSKNIFEVSANYTVYDFEDINPNYRSFSFRQMSMADSTTIKIKKNLSLLMFGSVKLSEQGDFYWKRFTGRPTRDLDEYLVESRLNLNYRKLLISFGFRYLSLSTYTYRSNIRSIESDYTSKGPIVTIDYTFNERLLLRFNGLYEFIKYEFTKNRKLASMNFQLYWQF